ncbi:13606_t:CDS:2 [Dentiscutata erythropus]|uniref:Histone-lysine N-methyltransferase SET5 n=1 Tax=Dentiscutata erythropus TaxID=1348616 RepID=A0A9N9EGF0_9GLOM|nr:13606_t:CDS:2 [Dentiscutata erythropus]
MELKKSVLIGIGVLGAIGIGYVVYWDYMRHNNKEFRNKWKRGRKKSAKRRKAAVEVAKDRITNFVKKAVDEVSKESFPTDVTAKEKYFMDQVSNGETLLAEGKERHLDAALCFYKALKVYPNPVELIMIYQKTIPEAVVNVIYEMMSFEVKKKKAEYFENFPPRDMNVRVEKISESSSSDDHIRRGLFATKDFWPGDVIFDEQPIASALDPDLETGDYCSYCLKELSGDPINDDTDLFEAVYCSKTCHEKAMSEYATLLFTNRDKTGKESKESQLVHLVKSGNVKYPLMIARFLAKMVHEETQKVITGEEEEYSTWDHIERLPLLNVPPNDKETNEIKLLRELFAAKVPGMEEFISEERYLMLKGKLMYNSFGISTTREIRENTQEMVRTSESSVIGAGFYRVASYMVHSCDPNIMINFPNRNNVISVVATKQIKAGEELKTSYIRVGNRTLESRRNELESKWKFRCTCAKCLSESTSD